MFQCSYRNPKNYHGLKFHNLAWKNDGHGYELNAPGFKGCKDTKQITTIPGNNDELNIFEGFFDYLSALVYYGIMHFEGTTIILNSVALIDRVYSKLECNTVNCYLDNDQAGEKAFKEIESRHTNAINQANIIYPDHKDFNDFLITRNKQ